MNNKTYSFTKVPPTMVAVAIYFNQKGMPKSAAEAFFKRYEEQSWKNNRGEIFKNWGEIARRDISIILKAQPWLFNRRIH